MAASNRIKAEMYILFSCNAWHEYSSFESKAVFSSIEKAADFLQKNRRKLKLEEDDIECFRLRLRAEIPITWYSPVPTIQSAQETWDDKESHS